MKTRQNYAHERERKILNHKNDNIDIESNMKFLIYIVLQNIISNFSLYFLLFFYFQKDSCNNLICFAPKSKIKVTGKAKT